ncbi:myb-like dna-binding shaqkyf class family protein [Stylonychia lemnae]|uniref:Myb-like dna-binding shaqkyf class family protein n=1 Tax=Stylonychia lemnae TaxID=5949 RepID=A0A077ZVZ3_STYLE|nr:myb-like dna-binding shaqkyf class family protein [Stylonychia lemnae]|eukprot:CDW73761.1 myb-like dna-binding shaqkyf class family protein [Stylonychia lemnae]
MEDFGSFVRKDGETSPARGKECDQANFIEQNSFFHKGYAQETDDNFNQNQRLINYAQEIESPYNRKKDALMDSDDDELATKGYQSKFSGKNVSQFSSLSPEPVRPVINLMPTDLNQGGNIPNQRVQNFFAENMAQLRPTDHQLYQIPMHLQQRHYSEQIFPNKYINSNIENDLDHSSNEREMTHSEKTRGKVEFQDIKQIPEKDESKESKDSTKQIKNGTLENEISVQNDGNFNQGIWSDEEHMKFLKGLILFGKNWNQIQKYIRLLIGQGPTMEPDDVGESDYSQDEKKRNVRKRSRVCSLKNERYKEKLINSENEVYRLEWEVVNHLNNSVSQKQPITVSTSTKSQNEKSASQQSPTRQSQASFFKNNVAPQLQSLNDKSTKQEEQEDSPAKRKRSFKSPEINQKPSRKQSIIQKQSATSLPQIAIPSKSNGKSPVVNGLESPQKLKEIVKQTSTGVIGKRKKYQNKIDFEKLVKMQQNQKFKKLFDIQKINPEDREQYMRNNSSSYSDDYYQNHDYPEYDSKYDSQANFEKSVEELNPNWSQIRLPIKDMINKIQIKHYQQNFGTHLQGNMIPPNPHIIDYVQMTYQNQLNHQLSFTQPANSNNINNNNNNILGMNEYNPISDMYGSTNLLEDNSSSPNIINLQNQTIIPHLGNFSVLDGPLSTIRINNIMGGVDDDMFLNNEF